MEPTSPTTPVIGAAGAAYGFLGLPLSLWVTLATLVFLALQIIVILPKVVDSLKKLFRKESHVESIDDPP